MPFTSKTQARYMFAVHPSIAKEFAAKTKSMKSLPQYSSKKEVKRKPTVPKVA